MTNQLEKEKQMTNFNHINQINNNKHAILNYLSGKSELFTFSFLSSADKIKTKENQNKRTDLAGCHFMFTPFENTEGFAVYGQPQYYYISFNTWEDNSNLNLCLREDYVKYLLDYQKLYDIKDKTFMVITKDNIFEVPFEKVLLYYINNKKSAVQQNNLYRTVYIPLTDETCTNKAEKNMWFYKKPDCANTYDPKYFNPCYIGNFRYASYISATNVSMYNVSNDGEVLQKRTFRSIKECFDVLKSNNVVEFSYKTLQRKVAAGEVFLDTAKGKLILTLEDDIESFELEEVVDATMPNPCFIESEPENDIDNMRDIVTLSHYELKNKKSKAEVEKVIDSIEEKEEIHDVDFEDCDLNEMPQNLVEDYYDEMAKLSVYKNGSIGSVMKDVILKIKYFEEYTESVAV